jgi:endonuclease YncB( thermonuclease family)
MQLLMSIFSNEARPLFVRKSSSQRLELRAQSRSISCVASNSTDLHPNGANDGDSFHVRADGRQRIFRLYFVDSPEAESGGYVTERVSQQAKVFGINEAESVAVGKKAAAFTRAVLSRPFTVTTRGQNALGASKLPREYAFVTTASGEDLGEMLVSRGLARSFGEDASGPKGSATALRAKYDRLEAQARRERAGAWGEGAATPTLELGSKPAEKPTNDAKADPHTGVPDISDLMPSADDILGGSH